MARRLTGSARIQQPRELENGGLRARTLVTGVESRRSISAPRKILIKGISLPASSDRLPWKPDSTTRVYVYMHILARVERCRARRRAIDIPDWTKIPRPGPVTQNWKHFTRRRGRRHVSRIRSNKLRGIGNRRPRTKPHTRPTLPPPPAPSSPPSIFFPCPRVRQPGPGRDFAPISLSNSPILWK